MKLTNVKRKDFIIENSDGTIEFPISMHYALMSDQGLVLSTFYDGENHYAENLTVRGHQEKVTLLGWGDWDGERTIYKFNKNSAGGIIIK